MGIVQVLFLVFFPCLIIIAKRFSKKLNFISPLILCYLVGIIMGNMKFIPVDYDLSMTISQAVVPLAIPLILFSSDFGKWIHMAGKTLLSFFLMIVSVLAASTIAALLFSGGGGEFWKVSGMLTAIYTGGTLNLMSVGMGLGVQEETIVLVTASSTILGGVYLLFLLTGAKWLIGKFLPPFKGGENAEDMVLPTGSIRFAGISAAFGLSAAIVGISVGIVVLITGKIAMDMIMLVLTTLSIAASFIKKVRYIKGTYEMGQYFILVFALAIGTNISLDRLMSSNPSIVIFTALIMMGSILLHLILSAIFRIDVDTTIIISTAGIYGPAITGTVAGSLKNREILISGLSCSLAGYAFGTYLGMGLAMLLMPK